MSRTARRNTFRQKEILARLAEIDANSPQFESVLQEAVDAISHHVEEEEVRRCCPPSDPSSAPSVGPNWRTPSSPLGNHIWGAARRPRKADLEQQAANIGITGASQKSKGELSEELSRKAEESEE